MLERDGELAALDAALAEMGTLVVVGGRAEVGKSSLIGAAHARADGCTEGADALLAEATTWSAWMVGRHSVRARVRLAQGRPEVALESLERQFAPCSSPSRRSRCTCATPTRS